VLPLPFNSVSLQTCTIRASFHDLNQQIGSSLVAPLELLILWLPASFVGFKKSRVTFCCKRVELVKGSATEAIHRKRRSLPAPDPCMFTLAEMLVSSWLRFSGPLVSYWFYDCEGERTGRKARINEYRTPKCNVRYNTRIFTSAVTSLLAFHVFHAHSILLFSFVQHISGRQTD
jgi:hypothetical protein